MKLETDVQSSGTEPVHFTRQVMRTTPEQEYLEGAIDDVLIINRALSGDELRPHLQSKVVP